MGEGTSTLASVQEVLGKLSPFVGRRLHFAVFEITVAPTWTTFNLCRLGFGRLSGGALGRLFVGHLREFFPLLRSWLVFSRPTVRSFYFLSPIFAPPISTGRRRFFCLVSFLIQNVGQTFGVGEFFLFLRHPSFFSGIFSASDCLVHRNYG